MVVFAFFGVIFGGLHCIGWDFTYPTPFEQHLWRATSLAITAIPLIVAPTDYILDNFELNRGFAKVVRLVLDLVVTILLFIYVPARLSLIAQALALLRNQPQTAFIAVDWAQYIPIFSSLPLNYFTSTAMDVLAILFDCTIRSRICGVL